MALQLDIMISMEEYQKRDTQFRVRLTPAEHEVIKREAFERNISMGSLIRLSVAFFIKNFNEDEDER